LKSCGLVAAAITAIPGSSDVFDRGFITYSYRDVANRHRAKAAAYFKAARACAVKSVGKRTLRNESIYLIQK
jgi:hypothetical protein